MEGALAQSTHQELERRLKRMNKDFMTLKAAGKVQSTNPEKFVDMDVLAYIAFLRSRGMADSGIDHNIDGLNGLLRFLGNAAVDQARKRFPQHFPHGTARRMDPISDGDRAAIIDAAARVPVEDWRRMEAYAMSILGICSGLRPKELRLAKIGDLDLDRGTMHAEEVKGKGRYGEPRDAAIHPHGVPFLRRYLRARAMALANEYLVSDLLFPSLQNLQKGRDGVFSINGTTDLRAIVRRETGVEYDLRACRRTWGQVGIDSGVPLDAVSRMMGHATTKTTETYYARKKNDKAIAEAQMVWGTLQTPDPASLPRPRPSYPADDRRRRANRYERWCGRRPAPASVSRECVPKINQEGNEENPLPPFSLLAAA